MLLNLKTAIDEKYGNQVEAASALKMDAGNLSKLIDTDNPKKLRKPTIVKIRTAFPEYNIDWILYNQGFKHDNKTPKNKTAEANPIYQDIIQVPIVEKRARAGYPSAFTDPEYIESLRKIHVPKQYEKGNYLVFEIDGNSMDDGSKRSICNNDAVLCKELDRDRWKEKLFYNKYLFIIVTADDVVCKQITNHNISTGIINCHSFNPAYEDFELNLNEIYQLFYLVKMVERDLNF